MTKYLEILRLKSLDLQRAKTEKVGSKKVACERRDVAKNFA